MVRGAGRKSSSETGGKCPFTPRKIVFWYRPEPHSCVKITIFKWYFVVTPWFVIFCKMPLIICQNPVGVNLPYLEIYFVDKSGSSWYF